MRGNVCRQGVVLGLVVVLGGAATSGLAPADAHLDVDLTFLDGPGVEWCDDIVVGVDQAAWLEAGCRAGEIRPGARGNGCTLDFVVTDGSDFYIGTAGHCGGVGRAFQVAGVGRIGQVVFREFSNDLIDFRDWAFIKVDEDKEAFVSGRMYHFGGPFAVHEALLTRPPVVGDGLFQYGHGTGWGQDDATKGRAGQVAVLLGTTAFGYLGSVGGGDSGSPVRFATGEAAGIAVAVAGVQSGDNREYVRERCAEVDAATGATESCMGYEAVCPELDGACVGPLRPGALYGLVIVTRFDAAKAALEDWLGHATAVVPGALPGVGTVP